MAPRKTAKTVEPTGFNVNIKHLHKALRLMLRFASVALPPLKRIFDAALATAKEAAPMTAACGLDASFVARFHLDRSGMPAVFWPAPPQKPILVTVSDEFMGVIMPVRVVRPSDEQLALIEAELRTAADPPSSAVA